MDFSTQIADAWKRVTRLREGGNRGGGTVPETYDELLTAYEELRVADEELSVQQEEIERAREAVEAERVKYLELFEFAPDAYLVTDAEGVITESNRAATQLLGVSRRFLTDKALVSFIAGDDRRLFRDLLSRLRRVSRVPDFTIRLRPRRSDPIDAALTVAAVRDLDGRLSGLRWMLRDISAQTKNQAEIRRLRDELHAANQDLERRVVERTDDLRAALEAHDEAQASLQTLLSAAPIGIAFLDHDCQYVRANESLARMIGKSPETLIGASVEPDARGPVRADLLRCVLETNTPIIDAELSGHSPASPGSEEHWLVNYYPVNIHKELIGVGVTVTDITDRKRIEESLRRYHDIFRFAEQGIAVDGSDGKPLQKVNPAFAQLHGYEDQEMIGMPSLTIVPERDHAWYESQQRLAEVKGHHVFEAVHRDKKGRAFPVEIDTTAVRTESGETLYRIVSVTDITERKMAEEAVNAAYEREHKIAQALQKSLLTEPPPAAFPDMTIETFYEPAMDEALVGGDFFDVLPLPDGKVAMLVGDVTGKGLAAAEQMAAIKHLLRAFLWSAPDPAHAMALLNDFLCDAPRRGDAAQFSPVVVALAVMDPATGEGVYVSGGADNLVVAHADDGTASRTERLDANGMLLGVQPGVTFGTAHFRLAHGDWLMMATDGLTEARQGARFLGIDGLVRLAQEAAPLGTLRERGEGILGRTRAFAGGALRDDACLLLAQRKPYAA